MLVKQDRSWSKGGALDSPPKLSRAATIEFLYCNQDRERPELHP